jgi:nitrite reductase (NADH) small subunit
MSDAKSAQTFDAPQAPEGFVYAGRTDALAPGQATVVRVNDKPIAVFNVSGRFYAIYNICPHEGGPLHEGRLKGCVVSCPWHDLAFDVRTGQGTEGGGYCVGSYEVRVDGSHIYVGARRKV